MIILDRNEKEKNNGKEKHIIMIGIYGGKADYRWYENLYNKFNKKK